MSGPLQLWLVCHDDNGRQNRGVPWGLSRRLDRLSVEKIEERYTKRPLPYETWLRLKVLNAGCEWQRIGGLYGAVAMAGMTCTGPGYYSRWSSHPRDAEHQGAESNGHARDCCSTRPSGRLLPCSLATERGLMRRIVQENLWYHCELAPVLDCAELRSERLHPSAISGSQHEPANRPATGAS